MRGVERSIKGIHCTVKETELTPRRVLVIAYYFPPMGLSGVQRTAKFVKYLPQFGWHPTVITVEPGGYLAHDESLLEDVDSKSIRIERTPGVGPGALWGRKKVVRLPSEGVRKLLSRVSDTFFIPDNKIGWKRKAVRLAAALHNEAPFDVIFATAPPFTDFLIGAKLKSLLRIPVVYDYRDPWIDYPFKFYPTPFHKLLHRSLEKKVLRSSNQVVTTNRRVKELLIQRYTFLTHHDIHIIPQGFDPEDFEAHAVRGKKMPPAKRRMRITYAGIFWEDRVPRYFLQALHDLFEERPALKGRIEARFIGTFRDENLRLVDRLGLGHAVTILNYLPHNECIRELMDSDVLWMIVGDDLGSPGKTYEYIGARKPILGCVPDGFIKSAIQEAGGKTVRPEDVQGIKKALEEFFELYSKNALKGPSPAVVEKYNRVGLTGALGRIFESVRESKA